MVWWTICRSLTLVVACIGMSTTAIATTDLHSKHNEQAISRVDAIRAALIDTPDLKSPIDFLQHERHMRIAQFWRDYWPNWPNWPNLWRNFWPNY